MLMLRALALARRISGASGMMWTDVLSFSQAEVYAFCNIKYIKASDYTCDFSMHVCSGLKVSSTSGTLFMIWLLAVARAKSMESISLLNLKLEG